GVAQPVSIRCDLFGTGKVSEDKLTAAIREVFDLRPASIIRDLELKRPVFRRTASYGHFGRQEFAWERLNRVEQLRKKLGSLSSPTATPTA
ncbi:MAG TPA: methionine adenosyltransferase domain-containing protein, partial [Planctomycetota bacterium]|nr:methionine adenosyltransferase domain-containing protein [Planctomycetota bacterium]